MIKKSYFCTETNHSIEAITSLGAKLVRQILADEDILFINKPLVFKE